MFLVRTTETEIIIPSATKYDVYDGIVSFYVEGRHSDKDSGIYIPPHVITYMEYKKDAA